jgi:hypothetical protein
VAGVGSMPDRIWDGFVSQAVSDKLKIDANENRCMGRMTQT